MALNTVSSDRLSTNVKNTNFTAAEKQDLTNDILPLATQFGQSKNLIINGAFQVAQRGTSSTSSAYHTVDRWQVNHSVQNAPTQAQVDVASGTTPYTLGFRKALKVTNGDQSSGATAGSILYIRQFIESQNIAQSGWNYTSSSSYVTLSFWIKSSIAQSFPGHLRSRDGTSQRYLFQTGALTANTWTKITKTIPGNSNLQFDTDTTANAIDRGLDVVICPYMGTTYSDPGATFDQWQAEASGNFAGTDMTTTWFTTNDATLEITGVQLEVGSVATDFEHRSFGDELARCQRYFTQSYPHGVVAGSNSTATVLRKLASGNGYDDIAMFQFPTEMRAVPTIALYNPFNGTVNGFRGDSGNYTGAAINTATTRGVSIYKNASVTATVFMSIHATASAEL